LEPVVGDLPNIESNIDGTTSIITKKKVLVALGTIAGGPFPHLISSIVGTTSISKVLGALEPIAGGSSNMSFNSSDIMVKSNMLGALAPISGVLSSF
jgi:hypothetical protein